MRYALDASFNGDNGVMKKSYRNRTGVGFSVDYRLKNFQVKNYISYGYVKAQEQMIQKLKRLLKFMNLMHLTTQKIQGLIMTITEVQER